MRSGRSVPGKSTVCSAKSGTSRRPEAGNLRGVGTGRERRNDHGVLAVRGQGKRADLCEGRGVDRVPVVVAGDNGAGGVENAEGRIGQCARDTKRPEPGTDGADEHGFVARAGNHKTADEDVGLRAHLAAGGDVGEAGSKASMINKIFFLKSL